MMGRGRGRPTGWGFPSLDGAVLNTIRILVAAARRSTEAIDELEESILESFASRTNKVVECGRYDRSIFPSSVGKSWLYVSTRLRTNHTVEIATSGGKVEVEPNRLLSREPKILRRPGCCAVRLTKLSRFSTHHNLLVSLLRSAFTGR